MQGVQQALDEKLPLDQYVGVAVIVHPPPSDAGADAVQIDGQIYVGVVLDLNGQLSFVAQETGHALMTVDHSWGPTGEYGDPYCVMSAWVWGGFDPSYQRPAADASMGAQYWSRAGPMVAAAMLANYVPDVTNSYSTAEVDPDFVNSPRLLTLSALSDATLRLAVNAPGSPAVGVIPTDTSRFFVEYRRQEGWDQGLTGASLTPYGFPAPEAGVVVHGLDPNGHVSYRGLIRVPPVGKRDWNDAGSGITVELAAFDPARPEEVTLRVGGPTLFANRRVELEIGRLATISMYRHTSGTETFARPKDMCPEGTYRWFASRDSQRVQCRAAAFGFDDPLFGWYVEGTALGSGVSTMSVSTSVAIPQPHGVAYQNRTVDLSCTVKDDLLEIFAEGGQGAFALHVKAVVSERADPTQSAEWTEFVGFETESLVFEQRYYDDLDACLKQIQEIGEHRIKQSVLTKFIDKGDPPAKLWLSPSEQWSMYHAKLQLALLASEDEELAQQFSEVVSRRLGVPRELLVG